MKRTVFFSWQSDTEQAVNRYLIRDALEAAAKRLAIPCEVDEATRGVAGSPAIFETILRKIEQSAVFVVDVTIATGGEGRPSCNPNVLVEYGYALAKLGEHRLVPVLNRYFGSPEKLPFDLRHKAVRAIYNLAPDATKEQIKAAKQSLEGALRSELRLILEDPKSVFGLTEDESRIVQYLSKASQSGFGRTYRNIEDVSREAGIDIGAARAAVAELTSRGYLEQRKGLGKDSLPVMATSSLFWDFDLYVHGWNPREDARVVVQALVEKSNAGSGQLNTRELASQQGWSLRRLNPALSYLTTADIVIASQEVSADVVTGHILEASATRSFLRGDYNPDSRRRR
jgi:hypothetical protein